MSFKGYLPRPCIKCGKMFQKISKNNFVCPECQFKSRMSRHPPKANGIDLRRIINVITR